MTTFKPTHRLKGGELLELEHVFTSRASGAECGLFHLKNGSYVSFQMDSVTEIPKTIQVAAHEEQESACWRVIDATERAHGILAAEDNNG